jgi:PhnB protein
LIKLFFFIDGVLNVAKAKKKTSAAKKKPFSKMKKVVAKKTVKRKAKKVAPIPKGYHTVTPYLIVNGGVRAVEFYKKAFGAKAVVCMEQGGKLGHAELTIGDSKIMLSDGCPEMKTPSPKELGGSPVSIYLYVKDVDAIVKRAIAAGAKVVRPVEDQFYGDRSGGVEDPFGHQWYVATRIENLTTTQIKKRAAELFGKK